MAWPDDVGPKDLKITFSRGSGPGGQKRNKTSSKCQITHIPTGLSVTCDDTRSAIENRRLAFRRLAEKLVPLMVGSADRERNLSGTTVVRTYTAKDDRVVDNRLQGARYSYHDILFEDGLEKIMSGLILNDTKT